MAVTAVVVVAARAEEVVAVVVFKGPAAVVVAVVASGVQPDMPDSSSAKAKKMAAKARCGFFIVPPHA
jgi:16S rRNA C1402 (ribose-2'-O) methylase RsmI